MVINQDKFMEMILTGSYAWIDENVQFAVAVFIIFILNLYLQEEP